MSSSKYYHFDTLCSQGSAHKALKIKMASALLNLMNKSYASPSYFPSTITDIHEGKVLTVNDALSKPECRALINFIEQSPNVTTTHQERTREYTYRHNDRLQLDDSSFACFLFARMKPLLATHPSFANAVGLNPNIRLYRYEEGMRFDAHYDESVTTANGTTKWTVLYYLNTLSLASGGSTDFYINGHEKHEAASVSPIEGSACLHIHGDECLLHKGAEVTLGVKYLLRTDIVFSE